MMCTHPIMAWKLAIRWTIGDVGRRGFDALALSIESAIKLFGPEAAFAVSVNTIGILEAQRRVGSIADRVSWRRADGHTPHWLAPYLDPNYAEGVAWKFVPVRLFPDHHELSLDNDVILWDIPPSIDTWLSDGDSCLIAEDVSACFGKFERLCGPKPFNSGIRGLLPGYDFESELHALLRLNPVIMSSEVDEQGLQAAAMSLQKRRVLTLSEVTITGAFPPHLPNLGRCGAHFVGVNAKKLPWHYLGRSGEEYVQENWDRHLETVTRLVKTCRLWENRKPAFS
jgi:hypothetical protein